MAVIGTGLIGWLLNIVLVLCSGPLENLPGPSGSAFLQVTHAHHSLLIENLSSRRSWLIA